MSTETVALMVQVELNRLFGYLPPVEQIDFVKCAGLHNVWMCYVYCPDGSECDPFTIENPPPFSRHAVERALVCGCHETAH